MTPSIISRNELSIMVKKYRRDLREANAKIESLEKTIESMSKKVYITMMQNKLDTISRDRARLAAENVILREKVTEKNEENMEVKKRNTVLEERHTISRALLGETTIFPILDVTNTLEKLNICIHEVAIFLAKNIVHTPQELFEEEISRSEGITRLILGGRLMKNVNSLSLRPSLLPLNSLFVTLMFRIFMVKFCGKEVELFELACGESGNVKSVARPKNPTTNNITYSQHSAHDNDLKSEFLQRIAHIFKAASWALPGATKRSEFTRLLKPFFDSLEALKASQKIIESRGMTLSIARADGRSVSASVPYPEEGDDSGEKAGKEGIMPLNIGLCKFQSIDEDETRGRLTAIIPPIFVGHSSLVLTFPASKLNSRPQSQLDGSR